MVKENIYGHRKRLHWIVSHLSKGDRIVEVGCGTGIMITLPLFEMGFHVIGIDIDEESIAFGKGVFGERGMDPNTLRTTDLSSLDLYADVLIASEILEHLTEKEIYELMRNIRRVLKPGGKLLITVPNGHGWFEFESWLWFRMKGGVLFKRTRMDVICRVIKRYLLGSEIEDFTPSTLSGSSHVRRFTFQSIQRCLEDAGLRIVDVTGSVLIAGPFSNLFFTGCKTLMKLNCILGDWIPRMAAGYYIECRLA